jgi:acyl-CoA reductase-like NAD-dependent aldehyde dehydrogenase
MPSYSNLIAGAWVGAADGATFENRSPATGTCLGRFPLGTRADTEAAITAARAAFPAWAATPPPARGALLDRASRLLDERLERIAVALTQEEGKTLAEARAEVARARDILRYYAGEGWRNGGDVLPSTAPGELLYSRREPIGVVGVITPWNFPIAIPAWKIAPALVYGNTVVFKPASDAPHSATLLVAALVDAGIPAGVINLVTGAGSVVGDALVGHAAVAALSFTGSAPIGLPLYGHAIATRKRVQLEMGGKNALVILRDADLDEAVHLALVGGFGLTGQACTATSRVIVEADVADRFVDRLSAAAGGLRVGNGLDAGVQMGPMSSSVQLKSTLHYVALGHAEGARLRTGGAPTDGSSLFMQPTVFDEVEPAMRIAQDEIFGPVISVMRARDFDDALTKVNAVSYGLVASIVTNDLQRAFAFANEVETGVVKINQATTGLALHAPFGGFKASSANTFKEQGQAAVEFFTRTKTIAVGHG